MSDVIQENAAAHSSPARARLERLLEFLQHDPANLMLRKDAVREACGARQWDVAQELLDAGLQAHPDDAALLAQAGLVHSHRERYEEAVQVLNAALAQGLEPAEVRGNLAFALFMLRRHEEALALLTPPPMAFELPRTLLLRARCLQFLERRDEAIADCRTYLAQDADDAEGNGFLALLLYEQGERGAARGHVDRALRRDPKQCEALLTLASLDFDADQETLARVSFEKLLGAHPNCGRGWLGLALAELGRMQVKAAKRNVLLAAKYTPDHIGTWHVLAWIEIMLGNIGDAEHAFTQALELDRNFGETHGGLAVIAAMRGEEDESAPRHQTRAQARSRFPGRALRRNDFAGARGTERAGRNGVRAAAGATRSARRRRDLSRARTSPNDAHAEPGCFLAGASLTASTWCAGSPPFLASSYARCCVRG